uniref:O-GlcNAc transferase C-terminal domain-containing protein n=1 Tax=viral metagenome TaxID=1070528 RepID=A0A6C0H919_9ZZZZ
MIYIIIFNKFDNLICHIEYIFLKKETKIIFYEDLYNLISKLNSNDILIFINKILYPRNYFLDSINNIINDNNINFSYLSEKNEIFIIKKEYISIENNIINIKKEDNINIIFDEDYNLIDNIKPPDDINLDYIKLLKLNRNYDNIINFNIAYKSYEKYLKYIVKDNYCYNILLFIININDLKINLPKYNYYRITLFYITKNKKYIDKIKSFCINNNIISYHYLDPNNMQYLFNLNNKRLIWFEKILIIKSVKELIDELFDKLNNYHKIKDNIILDNIISISSTDFVCLTIFNNKYKLLSEILYDISNYIYSNNYKNTYILPCIKNNIKNISINDIDENYIEDQLMLLRNYNLILDNINNKIKLNYDPNNFLKLLTKKISLSILCKPESEFINDINLLIYSINDIEFLTNLIIIFSNIKNTNIMNKLYIKILKIYQEKNDNRFTQFILKAFFSILSTNMDIDSIKAIINFIYDDKYNLITIDKLKDIIMILLLNITKCFDNNTSLLEKLNSIINDIYNINDIMDIDKLLLIKENNKNNICLLHFLIFMTTNFSAYYNSFDEFIIKRNEIIKNLEYLVQLNNIPTCSLNEVFILPVCNFYLSYQGIPSVDIFKIKSQLIRKICPDINYKINTDFNNDKKNICFHSNYLSRWHSVFKDRHLIIKELSNNDKYNIYFSTFDDLNEDVKYLFGKAKHIKLPNQLDKIKNMLEELKLDILIYCEIGMDPRAYFMAHMKLAKIQINTWGHSDTSGIDTIDYFISSKYYELNYDESQKHYSEKLILLDSLCTSYVNPISKYNINMFKNRYEYGFTDEVTIFFCAQSLFKFNPIFDQYIINILVSNKNFILIILNGDQKHKIFQRFNYKNISSRIHIFPMMQHYHYLNLMYISDIILDPYPFGGCNSSFEAFSMNKVIVTHESNMINGRFTSGFYKKMGLDDIITYSSHEYIELAITLGNDKLYRKTIESRIKSNNNLFNDTDSISDWTTFIDDIIN